MPMTIKAIAEASGVSAATVSRIINGTARVAPEKRERVLAVIGERREPIRRREKTSRGVNIGVLLLPEAHFDSGQTLRAGRFPAREIHFIAAFSQYSAAGSGEQLPSRGAFRNADRRPPNRVGGAAPRGGTDSACLAELLLDGGGRKEYFNGK